MAPEAMTLLFTEARIGTMTLPNRLIRSATAEMMADEQGRPLEALTILYQTLARGGVGLIITGHMSVHPTGRAHPGMTGIYDDDLVPDLRRLALAVHAEGGVIVAQLNHAGRQTRAPGVLEALAPSASGPQGAKRVAARAMTEPEIEMLIDAYAQAARRAKEAGFDGVQIHAAHGYLISQFLSPLVNRRTDAWGGTLRNRTRFLGTVSAAIRHEVGHDYPVLVKLGIRDESEEGLTLHEGVEVVGRLGELGIDAVEISGGVAETGTFNIVGGIGPGRNEAYFRPWAQAARETAKIPVALVGGIRSLGVAEDVLTSGDAQFVSMCRPLICEPDLPKRWATGETEASACVSGNRCWPDRADLGVSCKCEGVDRGRS
jgi:2,4-dienoyl-CoA reductase-like NADH-dependent reductase (Old Yellow Enzyme family)